MNKHFLLFYAYLLWTSSAAFAQQGPDQKIYAQYKNESGKLKADTNKVLFYFKYAGLIETHKQIGDNIWDDTVWAIRVKAKALAYRLNYPKGIELSVYYEGANAEAKRNLPAAIRYFTEAAKIAESHRFYDDLYQIYNSCLNIYYYEADYPNAMDIAQKGLTVAEQLNDKEARAHYCNQIGFIYQKQDNTGQSISYFTAYLNLANQIHNRMMVADACNGIADGYLLKKEYKTSLSWFFKALNIYDKIKERSGGIDSERFEGTRTTSKHERTAYTLFKISTVYKQAGDYNLALRYSLAIFDIYNKRKRRAITVFNNYDLASYYINTGDIYRLLKDYRQSGIFLNKGLALARSINHREDMRDAYAALAKTYEGLHKYDSAYRYSTLHTQLKDSIISEESSLKIANLQARYDADKKDRALAAKALARNIFIISVVVLLTVSFLAYSRYLLKQKNKFQSQVNKQKTELFNAVMSAQDNERKRIAQDIHDSLGSVLSAAKLNLSGLEDQKTRLTKGQKEKYEIALGLLDDASAELRNISHNLMPATLLKLGLTAALQNLFDKISAAGTRISFTTHGIGERLDEGLEISIYRIVLELVNNVVKHAKANEVTVQLVKHPLYINITVEDNGKGFVQSQIAAGAKGMGLNSISSRIEYLKGTIDIDSGIGAGTTVVIDIPLEGSTHSMA